MKKRLIYIALMIAILLFYTLSISTEKKASVELKGTDKIKLTKFDIFPDSFPQINVLFSAEQSNGNPIWNLTIPDILLYEEGQKCKIDKLKRITDNAEIFLSLVVDHSESMSESEIYLDKNGNSVTPFSEWEEKYVDGRKVIFYKSESLDSTKFDKLVKNNPLQDMKNAVLSFLKNSKSKFDDLSIQLISFNTKVTNISKFYKDNHAKLISNINQLKPEGETAFYDAINSSLEYIKQQIGLKVIVAMTDGIDNKSKVNSENIIKIAKLYDIPIFIIGYGNIEFNELNKIAKESGGSFYYTHDSKTMTQIYEKVTKKLLSVYELTYTSNILASEQLTREVKINFFLESNQTENNTKTYSISEFRSSHEFVNDKLMEYSKKVDTLEINAIKNEALINYLHNKYRELKEINDWYAYFGLTMLFGLATVFFILWKRKSTEPELKNQMFPVILSVFPNPCVNELNLLYDLKGVASGELFIINVQGQLVKSLIINDINTIIIDVSDLAQGVFIIKLTTINGFVSSKFIKI